MKRFVLIAALLSSLFIVGCSNSGTLEEMDAPPGSVPTSTPPPGGVATGGAPTTATEPPGGAPSKEPAPP